MAIHENLNYHSQVSTGIFIGRFQPFHEGHRRCVDRILEEKDRCIILLRDTKTSKENPFDLEKRKALIRTEFAHEPRVIIDVLDDPDADMTVYIGRDVGYDLIQLDSQTESISATDIRRILYTKKQNTTS